MYLQTESMERLFDTILNLKNKEECRAYLKDLCTVKELQDMAQRLDTAILLSQLRKMGLDCDYYIPSRHRGD